MIAAEAASDAEKAQLCGQRARLVAACIAAGSGARGVRDAEERLSQRLTSHPSSRKTRGWMGHPISSDRSGLLTHSTRGVGETFDALLRRMERTAWPELLWRFSSLCEDRCPVEFTLSSEDDVVRYTTEVAGPEVAEHQRLEAACECLEELGLDAPPREMVDEWLGMQANATLRWGAWLGVRHSGGDRAAKLYIEVPRELKGWGPRPLTPGSRLHMIGFVLASGTLEHYFRTNTPDDAEHLTLLRSFRKHAHWPSLLESFGALRQMPGEAALRWTRFGYSLRSGADAMGPGGLTLFLDSEMCGGAGGVRRRFLERGRRSVYGALLGALPEDRLPSHGVVGVAAAASGRVELRVGVSALGLADLL